MKAGEIAALAMAFALLSTIVLVPRTYVMSPTLASIMKAQGIR